MANSYDYDSYGNIEASIEGIANPFTYTGREFDAESGLYYYRARYYDPATGRFLSEDPIVFTGGDVNLYTYVFNNPLTLADPSGTDTLTVGGTIRISKTFVQLFFPEFEGQGGSVGFAFSTPDISGGETDFGVFVTASGGGNDVGVGRVTVDIGKRACSVRDLQGRGAKFNVQILEGGATLLLDENNNIIGAELNIGTGLNVGGAGTITEVFSVRGILEGIFD